MQNSISFLRIDEKKKKQMPSFWGFRFSANSPPSLPVNFFHAAVLKCDPLFLDFLNRIRYHNLSTAQENMFK
jgi:hypothetical protein